MRIILRAKTWKMEVSYEGPRKEYDREGILVRILDCEPFALALH
jgi:hypothetical protein